MSNGKVIIIVLIARLIKKTEYKMGDYLTDYKSISSSVELDLKNYVTKEELKNITHVDIKTVVLH